jgi:hypothetical protein
MGSYNPDCLGNYNFERIAYYAKKRFVEGWDTVALLQQAETECEKEEIALVSLLDVEDDDIQNLKLNCSQCRMKDCRDQLRKLIQMELGRQQSADISQTVHK